MSEHTPTPWHVEVFEPCSVGMSTMSNETTQSLAHAVVIGGRRYTVAHTEQKVADVEWMPIPFSECDKTGIIRSRTIKEYELDRTPHPDAAFIVKAVNSHAALVEALKDCLGWHGGFQIKGECERKARAALALAGEAP